MKTFIQTIIWAIIELFVKTFIETIIETIIRLSSILVLHISRALSKTSYRVFAELGRVKTCQYLEERKVFCCFPRPFKLLSQKSRDKKRDRKRD